MRQGLFFASGLTLAAVFTIGSGFAVYGEMAPYVRRGIDTQDKIDRLEAGPNAPGLSQSSQYMVLDDCNSVLGSVDFVLLDDARKDLLNKSCTDTARAIIDVSPTSTYGWYVVALAASLKSDWAAMSQALVNAHDGAPNQEGFAYFRATLGFKQRAELTPEATAALTKDIVVSLSARRGIAWAARMYVFTPEARTFLTDAVEQAPADVQGRFLRAVKTTGQQL